MKIVKFGLLAILLAAASCSKDLADPEFPDAPAEPNKARVNITINVNSEETVTEGAKSARETAPAAVASDSVGAISTCYVSTGWGAEAAEASTRATDPATIAESEIHDIWALQFDPSGNLVGKPIYKEGLAGQANVTLMLTETTAGQDHTVHFITNTGNSTLFTVNNVATLGMFKALQHSFAGQSSVIAGNVLMMTGQYTGQIVDKVAIVAPVNIYRAVAKLSFSYDASAFRDGTFKVLSVQLKNVPTVSQYLLSSPPPAAYPTGNGGVIHADYLTEPTPHETRGTYVWYMPENVRGSNPAITREGHKSKDNAPAGQGDYASFVQVKGEASLADGSTKSIIYMFYIGRDITDYSVYRNTHHMMSIKFIGIDPADQRVIIDVASPTLSTNSHVVTGSITGTRAAVEATIVADGGGTVTTKGFYISTTSGFEPGESGVTDVPSRVLRKGGKGLSPMLGALPEAVTQASPIASLAESKAKGTVAIPYAPAAADTAASRAAFQPIKFETVFTGLSHVTTYYARPYATNEYGTTVGAQISFITNGLPTVGPATVPLSAVTTATVNYTILDNGASAITAQGVLYSETENFDPAATTGVTKITGTTPGIVDLGTSPNPALTPGTTYYTCGWATNSEGTSYGSQVSFKTLNPPTFGVVTLLDVAGKYVQASGSATILAPATLTDRGVMWNPADFADASAGTAGTAASIVGDNYTTKLGATHPGATWYLYPYAVNNAGAVFYGTAKYSHANMPATGTLTLTRLDGVNTTVGGTAAGAPGTGATAIAERGYVWSTAAAFDPVASGTRVAVAGTAAFANDALAGNPATFYAYTYAKNDQGHTTYSTQLTTDVLPTAPAPVENSGTDATTATVSVGQQTAGSEGTISARGIVYSTTADFDPRTATATEVAASPAAGTAQFTATITADLLTAHYVRTYATTPAGHKHYSAATEVLYTPPPDYAYVGWFAGELVRTGDEYQFNKLLGVALEDEAGNPKWANSNGNHSALAGGSVDGKGNTWRLHNNNQTDFPAANACMNRNANVAGILAAGSADAAKAHADYKWYLPAQNQLMAMWVAKEGITDPNLVPLAASSYWSATGGSTSYAWIVNFSNGHTDNLDKTNTSYKARCAREIMP